MAVTENSYTGNGSQTNYSFTFPYLKSTDVQVQVDAAVTTAWQFANATTVQFNTAPSNGAKIKILRDTNVDSLAATFYAGSSIKSEDLNDNYTQNLYKTQEVGNRYFSNTGGTMSGDLTLGEDVELIFEGATDDAHETKLTVADPTADRTITLPDVSGTVVTTGDTGTVATGMIAADAITSAKIADDAIDSSHIAANAVGIDQIANNAVGQSELTTNSVTTAKIVDDAVTTQKIAPDSIVGSRIADDQINSEHYVDGSIDTQHIADNQITTAKIVNDAVTADKLANTSVTAGTYSAADITVDAQGRVTAASSGAIATSEITDGAVNTSKLGADSVTGAKIADNAIDSEHYTDGSIDTAHIADANVTTAKIANNAITAAKIASNAVTNAKIGNSAIGDSKIATGAVTTDKIAADAVNSAKIADNSINSEHYVDGSIDTDHIANYNITNTKLATNSVDHAKIVDANVTEAKLQNNSVTISKLGCEQTTISDSDSHIPTSGAVVDYVAAQIAPLGGLEVIATEVAFPNTQPASGVVISISDAGGVVVNGSGVSTTGRTVGGSTVTINGFPSSLQSSTLAAGIGLLVSSTGSSQTYNYHKILGKEDDIKQLSDDINDFQSRYRVSGSAPTSSLDNGDLWFDTANGKMMVYNSTNTAWEEVSAIGSFNINTLSSSGSTGGGSATFNGTAYRFTLSNPPQDAQQLLVSINGVIQKPNTGSSQPSEGFAISGNDIIFSAAPASGSSSFIITLGQAVQIGTPSDGSVSTAKLTSGAVTTAKIADGAVTAAKLASGAADLLADTSPQLGGDLDTNSHNIRLDDNHYVYFGDGDDFSIRHDGTYNRLKGANFIFNNAAGNESIIEAYENGAVNLYYDNSKKLETITWGVDIQGNTRTSGDFVVIDNGKFRAGYASDLQIYHDGTDSIITNSTGKLTLSNTSSDSSVYLQYGSSNKLYTDMSGVGIIGNLSVDSISTTDHVTIPDNKILKFGAGSDLQIYHDGSNSYLANTTGTLLLQNSGQTTVKGSTVQFENAAGSEVLLKAIQNGQVELYYDNAKKFETTSVGASVTGNLGIGIASPDVGNSAYNVVQVHSSSTNAYFKLSNGTTGSGSNDGVELSLSGSDAYLTNRESANLIFRTAATEQMRLNSDGALMIGCTVSRPAEFNHPDGLSIRGDVTGQLQNTVTDNMNMLLNRDGTDGTMIGFRKDGTGIGAIGVSGSDIYFQFGNTGTSAHQLDDYEEGTWTVGLDTGSNTSSLGYYVKIGKMVHIRGEITCDDTTSNTTVTVNGIPFQPLASSPGGATFEGSIRGYGAGDVSTNRFATNCTTDSGNKVYFGTMAAQGQGWEMIKHNDLHTNNAIRFTVTYQVA